MDGREINFTKHALERIVLRDISPDDIIRAIREGERIPEGKDKARYVLRGERDPDRHLSGVPRTGKGHNSDQEEVRRW